MCGLHRLFNMFTLWLLQDVFLLAVYSNISTKARIALTIVFGLFNITFFLYLNFISVYIGATLL